MSSKSFGFRKDGTLVVCRAKIENRGKGNCPHAEHLDLSIEQLKAGFLKTHNEKALLEFLKASGVDPIPVKLSRKAKKATFVPNTAFTMDELESNSDAVAEEIKNEDFQFIQEFYDRYEREMSTDEMLTSFQYSPAEKLQGYLESDEPSAVKLRAYLGEEVQLKHLSEILYEGVGAMTSAYHWSSSGRNSLPRAMLSTFRNDMTKKNYVASVLYFAGRCCYCNNPLNKQLRQPYQPSGEHITPVWPDNESSIVGGTRYGNMALACKKCNGDRGNKELHTWINETNCIRKIEKVNTLGRIKAFRDFAGYNDYSQEESDQLRTAIGRVNLEIDKLRDNNGQVIRGNGDIIRGQIEIELSKLA